MEVVLRGKGKFTPTPQPQKKRGYFLVFQERTSPTVMPSQKMPSGIRPLTTSANIPGVVPFMLTSLAHSKSTGIDLLESLF